MPAHRCRAPGCGRFVAAARETCDRHAEDAPAMTLDTEITAIRKVLHDVQEFEDVELRARLIPRIVSVSIQAVKTGHQLGNQVNSELMEMLERLDTEIEKHRHSSRHPE